MSSKPPVASLEVGLERSRDRPEAAARDSHGPHRAGGRYGALKPAGALDRRGPDAARYIHHAPAPARGEHASADQDRVHPARRHGDGGCRLHIAGAGQRLEGAVGGDRAAHRAGPHRERGDPVGPGDHGAGEAADAVDGHVAEAGEGGQAGPRGHVAAHNQVRDQTRRGDVPRGRHVAADGHPAGDRVAAVDDARQVAGQRERTPRPARDVEDPRALDAVRRDVLAARETVQAERPEDVARGARQTHHADLVGREAVHGARPDEGAEGQAACKDVPHRYG